MERLNDIVTVALDEAGEALVILDQTLLPGEKKTLRLASPEACHEAIASLRVRGAPAIGVAAGFAVYLAVKHSPAPDMPAFREDFARAKDYLASSRPTAVNLFWALERMEKVLDGQRDVAGAKAALRREAEAIRDEDEAMCLAIGKNGLSLLKPGMGLLTHCNAGALATAGIGTALGPIYLGQAQGYGFKVFSDETRPLLQGARLTSWELNQAGVDVTLITDSMAASVMKKGWVDAVLVGCDRVAANGDAANKIGTMPLAIAAKHFGIPFYVLGPSSTVDLDCPSGEDIPIELRRPEEIKEMWYEKPMAPEGVKAFNPAFDVTPASLITAIITEKGIVRPPFAEGLRATVKG